MTLPPTTADIVRGHIALHACCAPEQITDRDRLEFDLGLDSIDRVELALDIQDDLGIDCDDPAPGHVTVADWVAYFQAALANRRRVAA